MTNWLLHICPANIIALALTIYLLLHVYLIWLREYRWNQKRIHGGYPLVLTRWQHFVVTLSRSFGQRVYDWSRPFQDFSVEYEDRHCRCPKCQERKQPTT